MVGLIVGETGVLGSGSNGELSPVLVKMAMMAIIMKPIMAHIMYFFFFLEFEFKSNMPSRKDYDPIFNLPNS